MKRRSFMSIAALSAISIPNVTAEEELTPDNWYHTVNENNLTHKAVSEEGKLILNVNLITPADNEVTESRRKKGDFKCFRYQGKDLPSGFYPGSSLVTRFDLTWDGRPVKIPGRFWNDLARLQIETSTLNPEKLKPELRWKAHGFLEHLKQPRVILSAEGGTALIEWDRSEECDGRSTIRWIVTRSGTVLRHRYEPRHDC
jgi:hypothetical protein